MVQNIICDLIPKNCRLYLSLRGLSDVKFQQKKIVQYYVSSFALDFAGQCVCAQIRTPLFEF